MVLSHFANKWGLFDKLAPFTTKQNSNTSTTKHKQNKESQTQITNDEKIAHKLQEEENDRYQKLKRQYDMEEKAKEINQFAKRQRVLYHSKIDNKWMDAVVVGVHLDDGPDKPYYVSKKGGKGYTFISS
jgi:uncharacterized FlaG/YvyC family protein